MTYKMTQKIQKNDLKVRKHMKKNSLKWPKMTRNTLKSPKVYQKITYKIYISVISSSYPKFIYLRASHRIQGKKDDMSSKSGPW
jgi:hypothetical protein